jgi:S-adenosylmethionine:tRNA ribosyltransferase-isomerase
MRLLTTDSSKPIPPPLIEFLPHPAMKTRTLDTLDFTLPPELEAHAPPEARGLRRDGVKLMVSWTGCNCVEHGRFTDLPSHMCAGDVLVINTSGTLPAALHTERQPDGTPFELHLSTRLPGELWSVEIRALDGHTTRPYMEAKAGEVYMLPAGGAVRLLTPYDARLRAAGAPARLWVAALDLPVSLLDYLNAHGFPIRYSYVDQQWDISYYQTVYATEPGSAEMPSAGRAFTPELLTALSAMGVQIAPLLLHTGVASLEDHEPPYEEYYRVPEATAALVNAARAEGRRVIAVGTTAVRALETVIDKRGRVHPGEGWTGVVITPERGIRAVDGLLTGLHEPRASHLAMLEALAPRAHLRLAYEQALVRGYLWHEFGDLHLLLRGD